MAEYYRPRSGSSRRSHDMMLDIILRQGEAGAADALNRGDVLAGMFNTAGQAVNAHLANKEKQKAVAGMARRDAAWVAYIESGEWKKDPQQALTNAVRVWGPKEGPTQFNALQATAKIGQGNPEEDRKGLGVIIKAASKGGDAARARLWPSLKVMGNKVFPEVQLPDEYDPAMWSEIESYAPALLGEKEATPEPFTLSPGQQRFGPDGKPIAAIPEAPKEPKAETRGLEVQAAEALAKGDVETYQRLLRVKKEMGQADDRPRITVNTGAGLSPGMESNVLNRLTKQYDSAMKPAVELNRQLHLMETGLAESKKGNKNAGQQAVLVTFQKILDPTSVVRESEYSRTAAGQALLKRIEGAATRLSQGGAGFSDAEMEQFADFARQAVKAASGGYTSAVRERIGKTADRYKIPRELVIVDYDLATPEAAEPTQTRRNPFR